MSWFSLDFQTIIVMLDKINNTTKCQAKTYYGIGPNINFHKASLIKTLAPSFQSYSLYWFCLFFFLLFLSPFVPLLRRFM